MAVRVRKASLHRFSSRCEDVSTGGIHVLFLSISVRCVLGHVGEGLAVEPAGTRVH